MIDHNLFDDAFMVVIALPFKFYVAPFPMKRPTICRLHRRRE
jgi:hypothetical protein